MARLRALLPHLLVCLLPTPASFAQSVPPSNQAVKVSDEALAQRTDGILLGAEAVTIEALGLSIFLPEDTTYTSEMAGGTSVTTVLPSQGDPANPAWVISVQSRTTANPRLQLKDVADGAQNQLLKTAAENVVLVTPENARKLQNSALTTTDGTIDASGIAAAATSGQTQAVLLSREPGEGRTLTLGLAEGSRPVNVERFYVQFPPSAAKLAPKSANVVNHPVIRGVTIGKISATQFVVFELYTTLPNWEQAKRIYETVLAGARFENSENAQAQRAMLINAGVRLMDSVSEDELVALVENQPERWERIYKPSSTGKRTDDQEVGYRRVRTEYGSRARVDGRSSGRGAAALDRGLIVQIDARFLQGESVIDSKSIFFMSPDRGEETWSIAMTVKDAQGKQTHREAGARSDKTMTVRVESPGTEPANIMPQIAGEGYLSRVEGFLLPQLLVKKAIPAAYGFYAYQSQAETIQFRRDVLTQPRKEGEPWKLVSRLAEGQPEQTLFLDAKGNLVKGQLANGLVSEPIELAALLELWKSKGLPVD